MQFKVSVIIPVYNAALYLEAAVKSAAELPEVGEILLVEDGSSDVSPDLCRRLANQYSCVRMLQHPDGKNHGVAASRNLGILNAFHDHVAFLDADDYYLAGRFERAAELLGSENAPDGVYDAAQYETIYQAGDPQLYSLQEGVRPEELFQTLLEGNKGFFCTDTITIRKDLFKQAGMFREEMRMHEDSELWLRLAYFGKIVAGELAKPVAIIRRHESNAIHSRSIGSLIKFQETVLAFFRQHPLTRAQARSMLRGYWRARSMEHTGWKRRWVFYYHFLKDLTHLPEIFALKTQ